MNEEMINSKFELPLWFNGPERFKNALKEAWGYSYLELYEVRRDDLNIAPLEETVANITDLLWNNDNDLKVGHKRFVYAGLAFALAALPTLQTTKSGEIASNIIHYIKLWLEDVPGVSIPDANELISQRFTSSQAKDEAIDVFINLLEITEISKARNSLLEILDDCMEGFAIYPGSAWRRNLFNWFILEVMPAAWSLRLPDTIFK